MADARRTWRLQFGLGAAGLGASLLAAAVAVTRIELAVPSVGQLLDACRRWAISDVSAQSVLLLALGSTGLAAMALTLGSCVRQARAGRCFARRLEGLPGLPDVANGFVVDDDQPHAFCFGLLRPRVFVSRGTIAFLDRPELDAVIAHELHHARRRDPLRLFVARGLAEGLMVAGAIAAGATLFAFTARLAASTGHASVALPALVAELCMLAMAAVPLALGATALLAGRAMLRRRLG